MAVQRTVEERARHEKPLCCPKCGSGLSTELLVVEDEVGRETVLFIDCPRGDYHGAMTEKDVVKAITQKVMERLR